VSNTVVFLLALIVALVGASRLYREPKGDQMKSAFAKTEAHTFTYPEPLDPKNNKTRQETVYSKQNIDPEIMRDIDKGEAAPWVKIRVPRSKLDRDNIADATQNVAQGSTTGGGAILQARIAQGNRAVFELLCEGWWLEGADGIPPSGENFGKLDQWSAIWISACLVNVQQRAEPDFTEPEKNEGSSSGTTSDESDSSRMPEDGQNESTKATTSVSGIRQQKN
jgi:hypothetical protein